MDGSVDSSCFNNSCSLFPHSKTTDSPNLLAIFGMSFSCLFIGFDDDSSIWLILLLKLFCKKLVKCDDVDETSDLKWTIYLINQKR